MLAHAKRRTIARMVVSHERLERSTLTLAAGGGLLSPNIDTKPYRRLGRKLRKMRGAQTAELMGATLRDALDISVALENSVAGSTRHQRRAQRRRQRAQRRRNDRKMRAAIKRTHCGLSLGFGVPISPFGLSPGVVSTAKS